MSKLPNENRVVEAYNNLYCNVTSKKDFVTITIIDNKNSDFSDLFKILNKYPNARVDIRNIHTLTQLNKLCYALSVCKYSGSIIINLVSKISGNVSLEGLSNDKFINLEILPSNVKIKGFYLNNTQTDFTSWAHNLGVADRNILMKHLTECDKHVFIEQDKVVRLFYSEMLKACPGLMSYDVKNRFDVVFNYFKNNFLYADVMGIDGYIKPGFEYTHNAIETYKRREGVSDGRANLLTLVTNNSLLKINSSVVEGITEKEETIYGILPHTWNVIVTEDGSAYYYDLSFDKFTNREISEIGKRKIDVIYNSSVQDIYDRSLLQLSLPQQKNKSS